MQAQSYSFKDVNCTLQGPGGSVTLGNGAGVADEGITFEPSEDVGTLTTGADGTPMHSLHAARPGRAMVRILKTSPTNALLSQMFALQTSSSGNYGQNVLAVGNNVQGDLVNGQAVAFAKFPVVTWAKDANFNEWTFNVGLISWKLGNGVS